MENTTFSIKSALAYAWDEFTSRFWFYVGLSLIIFAASILMGIITAELETSMLAFFVAEVISTFVEWWLYLGLVSITLAVYAKQRAQFTDKKMKPLEALKKSGELTIGYKWNLLGYFVVIILINIAGFMLLGVGLLVALPITALSGTYVYKWLSDKGGVPAPEVAPAELNSEENSVE